jgi:acetylornithine deacetylase/succinyl-diaminopimelate desuccinylase-like protein
MSDMGLVSRFGSMPCICHAITRWDVEGMAHQPNEYVEVEKLMECLKTVVFCALDWCGHCTCLASPEG